MDAHEKNFITLFFTDIEGSTRLTQRLGSTYVEVLDQHNEIIRSIIQSHLGKQIDNPGDGFFIAFPDPLEAVRAAISIQKFMHSHHWPGDIQLRIRMALHWGQANPVNDKYTGVEVHRTSRICNAGHGGQVLLSTAMADKVKGKLPPGISIREIGAFLLKDFDEPETIFQLVIPDLKMNFPLLKAKAVFPVVAVLPFDNLSKDSQNNFLGEGIAEDIIVALGRMPGITVMAKSSSFAAKEKTMNARELGEKLNATVVLDGSLKKVNGSIQLTTKLIDVASGLDLWTKKFDRNIEDIFVIQDEIAQNIVSSLKVTAAPNQARSIQETQTTDMEAYDHYLRGRRFYYQFSFQGVKFALQMFRRALQLDPNYVLALCGLADCFSYLYMYNDQSPENLEESDLASKTAIELDPLLAEAYASRGLSLYLRKKMRDAEYAFEKAIELDPLLFEAYYSYGRMLFAEGNLKKAAWLFETAHQSRPDDYQAMLLAGQCYDVLGMQENALECRQKGVKITEDLLQLNPGNIRALYLGANGLVAMNEKAKGLQWLQRALMLEPEDAMLLYNAGCIYALCDMTDEALNCFEKAVKNGFTQKKWYVHDSNLNSLRQHPRFEELLYKMK
jgi:TolB-like protein/class 3 adenylate cyclase/Flp pilus assembly protein TadD